VKDPIIAEVRKHRMEHTKQFGSDLHKICEDLRRLEATLGNRMETPVSRRNTPAEIIQQEKR
jgi:hypothetical protein